MKERPRAKIHVLMPGDRIDAAALGLPLGLRPQRWHTLNQVRVRVAPPQKLGSVSWRGVTRLLEKYSENDSV